MPGKRWNRPTSKEKQEENLTVNPYPVLDHFNGRGVEEVEQGNEEWDWVIRLQGDVLIRNTDEQRTEAPSQIKGLALLNVVPSGVDTKLVFGQQTPSGPIGIQEVLVSPTEYSISIPGQPEPFYPQQVED